MLSLISFILVSIGCINWFSIGILQYDFVAGLFGSQSNIFSRLIYALVGIASIIMITNFVKNKGKFVISFNKAKKEYSDYMEEKRAENREKTLAAVEAEKDRSIRDKNDSTKNEKWKLEESSKTKMLDFSFFKLYNINV